MRKILIMLFLLCCTAGTFRQPVRQNINTSRQLYFDGISGYGQTLNPIYLTQNACSFSVWVNVDSYTGESQVIDLASDIMGLTAGVNNKFLIWSLTSGNYSLSINNITLHRWYHLVAVHDGVSTWNFYVDNHLDAQLSSVSPYQTRNDYTIKIAANILNKRHINGSISELAVWNRALSTAEINTIFTGKPKGNINIAPWNDGCIGLWHLTEGSGTTCVDSSGNGNSLNIYGGASWINSN